LSKALLVRLAPRISRVEATKVAATATPMTMPNPKNRPTDVHSCVEKTVP
jgi:hypothetical protein